jgi:hypothetical protein
MKVLKTVRRILLAVAAVATIDALLRNREKTARWQTLPMPKEDPNTRAGGETERL